jgi:Phage major capsid protein E
MPTALDRLVRKEVALGAIREAPLPEEHAGLQLVAPWMDVATDDVIFEYIKGGLQDGLAPARAEDAEAELAQKDEFLAGQGRAALIDWSLKDKYTASDVTRYREDLFIQQQLQGVQSQLQLNFQGRTTEDFQRRLARHDALRKRKLDNRIEWLIMSALETGGITYNDGKIKFTVSFGRPAGQQNVAPAGGLWGISASDPIGDILARQTYMDNLYGFHPTQALISKRIANSVWKSSRFLAAVGMPVVGGTPNVTLDPNYLGLSGYTPEGAMAIVRNATDVNFTVYDGIYRTRPIGSTTYTNNRFLSDNKVYFYPTNAQLGEIDDTGLGFARTLTSPHPEGNWGTGFYEWEDEQRDPWIHVRGSGVKAFPVFPLMEYSDVLTVL